MTTSRKHTHVGHCQSCARAHAINTKTGALAKHGYKVTFGYYSGTCTGAGKKSLNVDRAFADATVEALERFAKEQDKKVKALLDGKATLETVPNGKYEARDGKYLWDRDGRRIPIMVTWAEATVDQRTKAVEAAARDLAHNAAGARAHKKFLTDIIPKIHGTPLTPVAPVDADADRPLAVGDTVRVGGAKGYDATVLKIEVQECWGCGPYLNGKHLPHAVMRATDSEHEVSIPVRSIRRASIIKRAA